MSGKRKRSDTVVGKKRHRVEEQPQNPFELRVNRKKHDVLCWKSKSEKGLPGVSRSKAIQKRKKTLLEEYKRRNKSNKFVDRRFGEYDETLPAEEKMMRRFMLEKQKKHDRGAAYTLPGDETDQLTHYGQSLGDMESFDDIRITSDEENVEEEDIRDTHFGGFLKKKKKREETAADDNVEERTKTRKEILDEVVAKSKALKYERQQLKQKTESLLHDVDEQWKAVQGLVPKASSEDKSPPDDYDIAVRKMTFEARGKPTDGLRSEAELAAIEKEKLERQEMERIHRMKGLPPPGIQPHTSADHIVENSKNKRVKFMLSYDKDGRMVTSESSSNVEKEVKDAVEEQNFLDKDVQQERNESDEDEDSVDEQEGSEEGGDTAEQYGSDLESDEDDVDSKENLLGCTQDKDIGKTSIDPKMIDEAEQASKELPFVLQVPTSLEELHAVVQNRPPEELKTAVERIYACNHPSLSPQNKEKLKGFFEILVSYCLELAEDPSVKSFAAINCLTKTLFKLAQLDSIHSAAVLRAHLDSLFDHTHNAPCQYPSFSSLLIFKIIATLFPTSDHRHPVTTPAMLIMGFLLRKCNIRTFEDLCKGLTLVETLIEYIALSKRFVPEAVLFLTSVLGYFTIEKQGIVYPPFVHKCALRAQLSHLTATSEGETSMSLLQLIADISSNQWTGPTPACRNSVAMHCVRVVQKLADIYAAVPSFREIFFAARTNLESLLLQENWSPHEKEMFSTTVESIRSKSEVTKTALQLLKHKPISIQFYKPEFEEEYEVGRKKAVSRAVGDKQRLVHKVKREMKGAVREIRRDNAFLAREMLKEQLERDAERERKTRQIMQDLEEIQHETKKEKRK